MIPISRVVPTKEGEELLLKAYRSGRWSQGPMVELFEQKVAEISNCKYAVAVANGTIAIEAMLKALSNPGETVVTSPLTFRATIKAIEHAGMKPEFYDIDDEYLCLDESVLGVHAGWVMPVDLYGRDSGFKGSNVLSDSAQSIGIDMSRRRASSISFYSGKNVGCGEGGAVVTDDKDIANKIRLLRNQGMSGPYQYETTEGYNWRMTEIQAAIALPQLDTIKEDNLTRQINAIFYSKRFEGLTGLCFPPFLSASQNSWHQYTLRHAKRDDIVAYLRDKNIDARIYYPKLVSPGDQWHKTPVAQKAVQEIFSIPVHQHLTEEELAYISSTVMFAVKVVEDVI